MLAKRHRKFLRNGLVCASAAILLALTACGVAQTPAASLVSGHMGNSAVLIPGQQSGLAYDVVQVVGFGSAAGKPDVATLSLAVSVTEETVSAARTDAAAAMSQVIASLKSQGIADKDIATRDFRIYEEFEYGGEGRKHIGYTVSNGLMVTVRDTDEVGAVIDAAIAAGGDDIRFNNVGFSFSDTATLAEKAREAAVDDMQERASQLAEFANRSLGDIKILSETPVADIFPQSGGLRALAASAESSTPVPVGESKISVTVYGIYELLPLPSDDDE